MVDCALFENPGSHPWSRCLNIPGTCFQSLIMSLLEQTGWRNVTAQQVVDPKPIKSEFGL